MSIQFIAGFAVLNSLRMLKCDQPEKPKKTYTIPKVSKKRAAQIASWEWKPKEKKAIKPRSDKRAKQEREYRKQRIKHLEDNPKCLLCEASATEVHHPEGRIGYRLTDSKNFKGLCHDHHVWAEMNPEAAKEIKISNNRL